MLLLTAEVGESCRGAADCSALGEGAECGGEGGDKALCRCRQGFHASADGGACRVNAEGVGAVCEQDEDCVSPHTACPAGTCACIRGYTPDATGRSCVSGWYRRLTLELSTRVVFIFEKLCLKNVFPKQFFFF